MGRQEKGRRSNLILDISALIPVVTFTYVISQKLIALIGPWCTSWFRRHSLSMKRRGRFEEQSAMEVSLEATLAGRACRTALRRSPASCRVALAAHRARIDPALSNILKIVGDYEGKHGRTPLCESSRLGDVDTLQFLLSAGIGGCILSEGVKPKDLASGACRALLEHHYLAVQHLSIYPRDIIPAVIAHCTGSRVSMKFMPTVELSASKIEEAVQVLSLRTYHFNDPSFRWAPTNARASIFAWAQDVFAAQLVAIAEPFADLPEDCAADVWEYLIETAMTRIDMQHIVTNCSSPEALAWIGAVVAAAYAAKAGVDAAKPLRHAVLVGDLATVQDCILKGADLEIAGNTKSFERDGRVIETSNIRRVRDTHNKDKDSYTALMCATANGRTAIVKLLLEAGAYTEAIDEDGIMPLHRASIQGYTAIVGLLLQAGASVDSKNLDRGGVTPLMIASMNGYVDIMELLLQGGADVNTTNHDGKTALTCANLAGHANTKVIELLHEAGADLEAIDQYGDTALMNASKMGHNDVVELLFGAGTNIQVKNEAGNTALTYASLNGHAAVVKFLLGVGADIEAENNDGCSAILCASKKGHVTVVELLIQAGANTDTKDEFGNSPLRYAIAMRNAEVVSLLLQKKSLNQGHAIPTR